MKSNALNPLKNNPRLSILLDMLVDVHYIAQGEHVEHFDYECIARYYENNGNIDFKDHIGPLGNISTPEPIAEMDDILLYARFENEALSEKKDDKHILNEIIDDNFKRNWKENREHYRQEMQRTIEAYSLLFKFSPDPLISDIYSKYIKI